MKNFKTLLIIGGIVAAALIIWLIYTVVAKNPSTETVNANISNSNSNIYDDASQASTDTNQLTYTNSEHKFTFTYPKTLKAGMEEFTFLPYGGEGGQQVHTEASFIHEINTQYCAPSGECRPTTQDLAFNVSVINSPLSDVQKSLGGSAAQLKSETLGGKNVLEVSQGVEGEGINYYFVSLNEGSTLMFDQRYIDQNILVGYKTAPGFIVIDQQNKIMRDIISSLNFNK
jgi:hypothetical protein